MTNSRRRVLMPRERASASASAAAAAPDDWLHEQEARRRAATRLQRSVRRRMERTTLKQRCCGKLQKLEISAVPLPFGMEVVVWRARFVYATNDALCYQRLVGKSGKVDQTSVSLLRFADVTSILRDERTLILRLRRR